jgi:hypothetical protein
MLARRQVCDCDKRRGARILMRCGTTGQRGQDVIGNRARKCGKSKHAEWGKQGLADNE